MASNNNIYKMSNAGGFKSLTRYYDMLAGNTVWNPWSPAGAYESIATTTVGSGGSSSVSFTSIPSTYQHLQVRCFLQNNRATYGTSTYLLRLNSDSGSNYYNHILSGSGSSVSASAYSDTAVNPNDASGTGVSSAFGASIIDILDYTNTNKNTTLRMLNGIDINGTIAGSPGYVSLNSALWNNTAAVTTLTFTPAHGTVWNQYSSFALYGIRGN
jgi:hypothetical protein